MQLYDLDWRNLVFTPTIGNIQYSITTNGPSHLKLYKLDYNRNIVLEKDNMLIFELA